MKYRRKVTEVEAVQFTGSNHDEITAFAGHRFFWGAAETAAHPFVMTPSGQVAVEIGDYIAQNPKDATDFYPIKAAQFADLYEPAN